MSLNNSQYGQIMNHYDQIRSRQLREQDARRRELRDRIPELRVLEQEYSDHRAQLIQNLSGFSEEIRQQFQKETEDYLRKKAEILVSNGYPADYADLRYDCPDCKDTGLLPNGSHCHCFQKQVIEMIYENSNLTQIIERENFRTFSLEYYSKEETEPINKCSIYELMKYDLEECRRFADEFPTNPSLSLLITGPTGTGKSFLAHCIAEQLLRSGISVIRLTATELIEVFEDHMKRQSRYYSESDLAEDTDEMSSDELHHYLFECDLLIIDDLGSEMVNAFSINKVLNVVDLRQVRQKGTLITTNLNIALLRDTYTERVSSRIISGYRLLQTAGADIRRLRSRNG